MRLFFSLLAALLILIGATGLVTARDAYPSVTAQAYAVMDLETGELLLARNPHLKLPPASLTKIMTALVALERAELDEPVQVSTRALHVRGSRLGLRRGEQVELWKMLYGMLFRSGNDAAIAVAEAVAGSESAFVDLMNRKARAVGALNTHFRNPHGLPAYGHYSTAYDLALMARAAMANSTFAGIVSRETREVNWAGRERTIVNINTFLRLYSGATGIKTGYTSSAGYCLAASAQREGRHLVAIILNSRSSSARWRDAIRLLDYAFAHYEQLRSVPASRSARTYTVRPGDTLSELAQRFGTTVGELMRINGLRTWLIRAGETLLIPD